MKSSRPTDALRGDLERLRDNLITTKRHAESLLAEVQRQNGDQCDVLHLQAHIESLSSQLGQAIETLNRFDDRSTEIHERAE